MHNKSFTLLELLIVIAVIAILAAIVLVSLNTSLAKARDSKRISELNTLKRAITAHYSATGHYPYWLTPPPSDEGVCVESSSEFKSILGLSTAPKDPLYKESQCVSPYGVDCFCYIYKSEGNNKFKIFAKLEKGGKLIMEDGGVEDSRYELFGDTPGSSEILFSLPDSDLNQATEIYEGGRFVELNFINQRSVYNNYNGHPSGYLTWPMYFDQEIWKVNRDTKEKIEQITYPLTKGTFTYKITKCANDGQIEGCIPVTIGNRGTCTDGIVKNYGDLEHKTLEWKTYYDNDYRDCDTGNNYLLRNRPVEDTGATNTRINLYGYLYISGYGKYQLCAKYIHSQSGLSAIKCINFIIDFIDSDIAANSGGNKSYGSLISWQPLNPRTRFDSQPLISNWVNRRCYIQPWDWLHSVTSDNGPSIAFRRHGTYENYWGYAGLYFGISNTQAAGDRVATATYKFPNGCYLRDRDGTSDSAFYHHGCSWYHNVNGNDITVYCCGTTWSTTDTGTCDKFVVSGQYGGTLTITNHFDAKGDNYDEIAFYMECPNGETNSFGNSLDPYTVSVSGVDYFWVNNMDYSLEKTFSEALPDSKYTTATSDLSCNNLKLNLCGYARPYAEFFHYYDIYGNRYTDPNYICVSGPQCPHITCP